MSELHSFGRITLRNKIKCANRIKIGNEGVGPFLMKLDYYLQISSIKEKETIFLVFCIYEFLIRELNEIKKLSN